MEFINQTSFLCQRNDDETFLVAVGEKTFEGSAVSINFKVDDQYVMGMDNPSLFEIYEDVLFNTDIEVEPDGSISVEIEMIL